MNHDISEIVRATDPKEGLTAAKVAEMQEKFGKNELTPPRRLPVWRQYLKHYQDPIIRILLVAVLISGIGWRPCDHHSLYHRVPE